MAQTKASRRSPVGQVRVAIAWVCTIGALAFAVAGFVKPAWVGLEGNPAVLYLTAPPLVIAALIHLYLVTQGTRSPVEESDDRKHKKV